LYFGEVVLGHDRIKQILTFSGVLVLGVDQFITLIGRTLFTVRARHPQTAFGKIRFGRPNGVISCPGRQIYFVAGEWFMAVLTIQNPLRHLHRSEGQAENHHHINGLAADLLYH
jgi:hypothetical protein